MNLPIIVPDVHFDEVADDIAAIIGSGILTSGRYVAAFEEAVAAAVGVPHAVATTSATTALHLSLVAQGVRAGDDVLVSDFTFPASGNVIVEVGARPVLVDCLPGRFGLDVDDAARKITDRTRAIMAVHPFGQPADMAAVTDLASEAGLLVIEDAACAIGSAVDGRPCGSMHPGAFSFHPRKVVTTGEGGAVTTSDEGLAEHLRTLRAHGARPAAVGMEFVENGFNYRLSEISAALGLTQLRRLDGILADRARTAGRYEDRLAGVAGLSLRTPASNEVWSYQSFVVMVDESIDRNHVVSLLGAEGVETTLGTYAMHTHPAFARFGYRPGDLPHSFHAQEQSLTLPLVPRMADQDVDRAVAALEAALVSARRRA